MTGRPVLVTGAGGQLGRALAARLPGAVSLSRAALDVGDGEAVRAVMDRVRPRVVLNAAAFTRVDDAEDQREACWRANRDGPAWLAESCRRHGAALVHVSTDYVFDGTAAPYAEDAPAAPVNAYGLSKWEGEEAVRSLLAEHLVVRTSWVFGGGGDFASAMLRLCRERELLEAAVDQRNAPTPVGGLADGLVTLTRRILEEGPVSWGTSHLVGAPAVSRFDWVEAIVAAARRVGPVRCREVRGVPASRFPARAARPADSTLTMARLPAVGIGPPDWRAALERLARGETP